MNAGNDGKKKAIGAINDNITWIERLRTSYSSHDVDTADQRIKSLDSSDIASLLTIIICSCVHVCSIQRCPP